MLEINGFDSGALDLLFSTGRLALPIAFAVLGGLISEKSGTAQIGLEGMMLAGALVAATVTTLTGSPYWGMGGVVLVGLLLGLFMSVFVVELGGEQIIVGMALNLLVFGLAPFVTQLLFHSAGSTPPLAPELRFGSAFYVLFATVAVIYFFIFERTPFGLWIRFAGENPNVLLAAGVSVRFVRRLALILCGMLSAIGGSVLTLSLASSYSPMMTAGRGFMALASIIFGGWRPGPALLACLFFAFSDAVQIRMQGASSIPVQFIQILPYAATIVALAGFRRRGRPPQSLGT
ncbi:MAG: sugar ABC transporter permease [Bdellovibrio sp.]|nr:MAG: sugar ABC transporter permease [Bdellovibrio sp.]